jgi:nucleoside-diphosphate-sugar epimerase
MLQLADASRDAVETVNYNIDGMKPSPDAGQLADAVRARITGAVIDFAPDPAIQSLFADNHPVDDSCARDEWGWRPTFDHVAMVDDFVAELQRAPDRYR